MPTFEITAPDGTKYQVEGPEGATDQEALARVQLTHGGHDLSKWTNEQLMNIARGGAGKDLSTWSSDELKAIAGASSFTKGQIASDVAKSAGIGLAKGAIGVPGFPGDVAGMVPVAADWLRGKAVNYGLMTQEQADADRARESAKGMRDNPFYTSGDLQKKVEGVTGRFYEPRTTAGQFAQTVGEFMPMATMGPGSLARRALTGASSGAASEVAGQATAGTQYEPWARLAGAVVGGGIPNAAARVVTPFPSSPERATLANTLRNEGVNSLTAGQVTGSRPLRWAESASADIPFGSHAAASMDEAAKEEFTRATLRRIGEDAPRATPEIMARADDRISQAFADLSNRNYLHYDPAFVSDLTAVHNEYSNILNSQQKGIVANVLQDIYNQGTGMAGPMYQRTRSLLSKQSYAVRNNDPYLSGALRGIRNALDDAMDRSIAPQDAQAWRQARRQYGNMKVIENAVSGAGEQTQQGLISPQALRNAAVTGRRGAYARNEGDFDALARAGNVVMAPLQNSGTPARLHAMALMGGLTGLALGGVEGGLGGGMAGRIMEPAAQAIGSRALMSEPAQQYMRNQALANVIRNAPHERLGNKVLRAAVQSELPRRLNERDRVRY